MKDPGRFTRLHPFLVRIAVLGAHPDTPEMRADIEEAKRRFKDVEVFDLVKGGSHVWPPLKLPT